MPINLKYSVPPTFIVDGINYAACGNLRTPLPYTGPSGIPNELPLQMYSPFVEARFYRVSDFTDENMELVRSLQQELYYVSTGNFKGGGESRNAFIKSFKFSIRQSYGGELVIVDTSGRDFIGFYNTIYKNRCWSFADEEGNNQAVKTDDTFIVAVNVGYIFVNSEGIKVVYQPFLNSPSAALPGRPMGPYMNFYLTTVDVAVSKNIWTYTLKLSAADGPLSNDTVNSRVGSPEQPVPFLRAAEIFLDGSCPPKQVFANPNAVQKDNVLIVKPPQGINGGWEATGEKGAGSEPNATKPGLFAGYNLSPLDAIRKNMDTFVTRENKGVYMMYPSGANSRALYLVQADSVFCVQRRGLLAAFCGNYPFLGTYVVNGGDFSPVIEFNPKITFVGAPRKFSGGQGGGGANIQAAVQQTNACDPQEESIIDQEVSSATTGGQKIVLNGAVANDAWNKAPPKDLPKLQAQAAAGALRAEIASKPFLQGSITATMKVQGDPRLLWSLNVIGSVLKIIFINPFSIASLGEPQFGGITDWLATPLINSVISDGYYLVQGADHDVVDGNWVTILQLIQVPSSEEELKG